MKSKKIKSTSAKTQPTKYSFVPWHAVLYANVSTQLGHGFLTYLNSVVYKMKHGVNYENEITFKNHGLQPNIRASSIPTQSIVNFGMPF